MYGIKSYQIRMGLNRMRIGYLDLVHCVHLRGKKGKTECKVLKALCTHCLFCIGFLLFIGAHVVSVQMCTESMQDNVSATHSLI